MAKKEPTLKGLTKSQTTLYLLGPKNIKKIYERMRRYS